MALNGNILESIGDTPIIEIKQIETGQIGRAHV